jgi:chemotaxis protein methyltransferase CheR
MKYTLSENIISQLSGFIASNLALHFPKERWDDLERNIVTASKEFGYNDVGKFIQHIISSPPTREHMEILAALAKPIFGVNLKHLKHWNK